MFEINSRLYSRFGCNTIVSWTASHLWSCDYFFSCCGIFEGVIFLQRVCPKVRPTLSRISWNPRFELGSRSFLNILDFLKVHIFWSHWPRTYEGMYLDLVACHDGQPNISGLYLGAECFIKVLVHEITTTTATNNLYVPLVRATILPN